MHIYFAGSIRGGREDVEIYRQIVLHLQKCGTVLTEHVASDELTASGEAHLSEREIHDRDLAWLRQSDGNWALVSKM